MAIGQIRKTLDNQFSPLGYSLKGVRNYYKWIMARANVYAAPSLVEACCSSSAMLSPINSRCPARVSSYIRKATTLTFQAHSSPTLMRRNSNFICKAEYKFPDPIPEFADSETEKFKTHLLNKLSRKDMFGDSVDEVVGICTQIFNDFLHAEYGGPGTLLVIPFIDMADTINERGLPGGPRAARAAVKWAQAHVDKDWEEWTSP